MKTSSVDLDKSGPTVLNALIKTKNLISPPWLSKDLVEMISMALAS